jgi:hypothetical protein
LGAIRTASCGDNHDIPNGDSQGVLLLDSIQFRRDLEGPAINEDVALASIDIIVRLDPIPADVDHNGSILNGYGIAAFEAIVGQGHRDRTADEMDNIFDRFYRAEDNALIPGFRLGLTMAKVLERR